MPRSDMIEVEGIVTEALVGAKFKVTLDGGREIVAHPSGRLRMNSIRILPGDRVMMEVSPYDMGKGRITWRYK